ncbi:MAG: hypothetical protein K2X72_04315 [Reyranella sp.]|nr:hypothetical protein [Reyranella sp.]
MAAETDTDVASETVDMSEAAHLLGGAGDVGAAEPVEDNAAEVPAEAQAEPGDAEGLGGGAAPQAGDEPPDFWSPGDKALWPQLPEQLRTLLTKYERKRIAYGERRAREMAAVREDAARATQAARATAEQSAAWWQQNGPAFRQAFVDRWASVDWKALAEKDPAEVQRLIKQRQDEETLLADADRRGQADIAAAQERVKQELLAARQAEHAKLAERLPDFFGPERARQTYDELSRFLFAKGIPADRIAAIYEAPIIELALSALRFERAQAALHRSRGAKQGGTIRPTPTRIDPGPGNAPGSRTGEAIRQAGERFRQSGGTSIADAAELIRLSGL